MAGIKEVAEEAGVSTATVSRALRGLHHVNDSTRSKILAAAQKLNYPLTPMKGNTASGRTNSVGVVAPLRIITSKNNTYPSKDCEEEGIDGINKTNYIERNR